MAKQSITFVSEADEVIQGVVAFKGEGALGEAKLNTEAGTGTGSIELAVADLNTGNTDRDKHLVSEGWMNAEKFPNISFTDVTFKKVAPTVYELSGTWTMHGVSKEITIPAMFVWCLK